MDINIDKSIVKKVDELTKKQPWVQTINKIEEIVHNLNSENLEQEEKIYLLNFVLLLTKKYLNIEDEAYLRVRKMFRQYMDKVNDADSGIILLKDNESIISYVEGEIMELSYILEDESITLKEFYKDLEKKVRTHKHVLIKYAVLYVLLNLREHNILENLSRRKIMNKYHISHCMRVYVLERFTEVSMGINKKEKFFIRGVKEFNEYIIKMLKDK